MRIAVRPTTKPDHWTRGLESSEVAMTEAETHGTACNNYSNSSVQAGLRALKRSEAAREEECEQHRDQPRCRLWGDIVPRHYHSTHSHMHATYAPCSLCTHLRTGDPASLDSPPRGSYQNEQNISIEPFVDEMGQSWTVSSQIDPG